jgi:predicted DNA-binding transcriptional regulator YafY
LKEREKSLALYLRAQKSGVSASTIMNSISEYSFKNNPEKQAAARQKLLRDLQHLKKMGLAESEGVNRHTVWKAPIIPTKIELMDLDAAIAVMTLNVFGELPLDQRTSHRINELLTRASLTLEDSKLEKYRRLTEKIAFKPWVADRKKPTVATELYESVLDAVLSEQFVSLSYKNTSDVVTTKQGSPLGRITSRQIVYLIFF